MASQLTVGYWLSSEEHEPAALVQAAAQAEQAGFTAAMISDHFHPWVPDQGQSPFVWSVLGAISAVTSRLRIGTGVTAPIMRLHPVIVAQAAATVAAMMPGRFFLGVGSGERLNEQITGQHWPPTAQRRAMLREAIEVIRKLFEGKEVSHRGKYFTVEHAQLYTLPPQPPPIYVAASGPRSARLAARSGDGLIAVAPASGLIDLFEAGGGTGKPRIGQIHVCWDESEAQARKTAAHWWSIAALPGSVMTELARPKDIAALAAGVEPEEVAAKVVVGPNPRRHLDAISRFAAAGFTEVYVHQIGPDQTGFLDFYQREILPQIATTD